MFPGRGAAGRGPPEVASRAAGAAGALEGGAAGRQGELGDARQVLGALAAAGEGADVGRATERLEHALDRLAGPRIQGPRSGERPHQPMQLAAEVLAELGDRAGADLGVEGVAAQRPGDEAEASQAALDREAAMMPG